MEDKGLSEANGAAIIQTLQRELRILPVTPKGGKVARVNAVSAAIESGHVFVPEAGECSWVENYLEQWTVFPNGKHDDMVDASSQALNRLFECSGEVMEQVESHEEAMVLMHRLCLPEFPMPLPWQSQDRQF